MMRDTSGRTIRYLRLSVTDLCNYRCIYCMEPDGVCKKNHGEILSLEELLEIASACVALGVTKIRLTGGEPLVRRNIVWLCRELKKLPGLEELTLTTNGAYLPRFAQELKASGVDRLNISLDTLDPARYRAITRTGELKGALSGLAAAEAAGFTDTKINAVLLGGVNDGDIPALARLARDRAVSVRFIELMPMGVCRDWERERFISADAVRKALPELRYLDSDGVAERYTAPDWVGTVGLIRPVSHRFCRQCDRIRVTAEGRLKPCLHSATEIALRGLHGEALREAILRGVQAKPAHHELLETGSQSGRAMYEIGG